MLPQLLEGAPDPTPDPSDVLANTLIFATASGVAGYAAVSGLVEQVNAIEQVGAGVTGAVVGYAVGRVVVTKALELMNIRKSNRRHLTLQAEVADVSALADRLGLHNDF